MQKVLQQTTYRSTIPNQVSSQQTLTTFVTFFRKISAGKAVEREKLRYADSIRNGLSVFLAVKKRRKDHRMRMIVVREAPERVDFATSDYAVSDLVYLIESDEFCRGRRFL